MQQAYHTEWLHWADRGLRDGTTVVGWIGVAAWDAAEEKKLLRCWHRWLPGWVERSALAPTFPDMVRRRTRANDVRREPCDDDSLTLRSGQN